MTQLGDISAWLDANFARLLTEHQVPGAAIAVLKDGEVIEHAAGTLNTATGVEATTDSLFQIGSVTKVWTATLVMQLVDEGLLDLDAPLRTYLPDFRLADESAVEAITVRMLLCHTAGFEGDIFTDTGRGDDCVERFVVSLHDLPQLFAPGERFSYNNAGFCVLGRVIEVLRGKSYDECLAEYLFGPLGLRHAAAGPYEAILHRAAVGHLRPEPDSAPEPAPVWCLARSNGPAGAALAMSARDLLAFARMHLDGGTALDRTRVLSPGSVKAMQEIQVKLPELALMGQAWGLGWEIIRVDGPTMIGHDGGTIGQSAFLRVVPEHGIAVALLANGGDPVRTYREVVGHVLRELAGAELPSLPTPAQTPQRVDASRYVGTYSCDVVDYEVSQDEDGRIWLDETPKGAIADFGGKPERAELAHYDGDTLIRLDPVQGLYMLMAFVGEDADGNALYVHTGRATRRLGA
jgi:CubicO group peptidase (beta-lactamase class C family)